MPQTIDLNQLQLTSEMLHLTSILKPMLYKPTEVEKKAFLANFTKLLGDKKHMQISNKQQSMQQKEKLINLDITATYLVLTETRAIKKTVSKFEFDNYVLTINDRVMDASFITNFIQKIRDISEALDRGGFDVVTN